MKVTYIGHAALLAEINGVNILSDPWLVGPCFGVQWWQWPRSRAEALKDIDVHFIYILHGHNDHLHSGTLQRLDKSAKVLVSRNSSIAEAIEHMGFETIVLESERPVEIAPGISAEIIDTLNPDSMLVLSDGKEVLVNANDALLPVPEALQKRIIDHLRRRYGKIDYAFIGYGIASGFPNCHFVPGKNNAKSAEKRQRHFNGVWSSLIAGINPKYGLPFAADVVLLDENLIWANEPVHNRERPTDRFRLDHPESSTRVIDIAPGFTVIDGRITKEVVFEPVRLETLRAEMAARSARQTRRER